MWKMHPENTVNLPGKPLNLTCFNGKKNICDSNAIFASTRI